LHFMAQREFGPIPPEYSLWAITKRGNREWYALLTANVIYEADVSSYEHIITGHRLEEEPTETTGGILADDMGLGKTLTVICTIIRTAKSATLFAEESNAAERLSKDDARETRQIHSRATLVVVSSPCMRLSYLANFSIHGRGPALTN
jgi:SWI/SNF-related matrix-associated actin-dependent regulator of chromatin subfamily A3